VQHTGEIGFFKIISEASVAAGIRRIEAVTAAGAEAYIHDELQVFSELKAALKSTGNPVKQAENLHKEVAELRKALESYKAREASAAGKEWLSEIREINGIRLLAKRVQLDADSMKNICFEWKRTEQNMVAILGGVAEGKALLSVFVSDDLVAEKGLNAVQLTRELAKEIQGGGGGQPFFATAGGKNPEGLDAALEKASRLI
jgi:alanyl-tRNA synthetase